MIRSPLVERCHVAREEKRQVSIDIPEEIGFCFAAMRTNRGRN